MQPGQHLYCSLDRESNRYTFYLQDFKIGSSGLIQAILFKIQGLFKDFLKDYPTVFKDNK